MVSIRVLTTENQIFCDGQGQYPAGQPDLQPRKEQPRFMGDGYRVGVADRVQLLAYTFHVAADGILGNAENDCALPGGLSLGDPLQAFKLPG